MMAERWEPTPRLVQPRNWLVLACDPRDARVDLDAGQAHLPKPRLAEDLLIQVHELTHIALARQDGVVGFTGSQLRILFRLMLEEIRVEVCAAVDVRQARDAYDWTQEEVPTERHQLAAMVLQLVHSCMPPGGARNRAIHDYLSQVGSSLAGPDVLILMRAYESTRDVPTHANAEQWADRLAEHFAPPADPPEQRKEPTERAREAREEVEQEEKEAQEARERQEARAGEIDQTAEHREAEPGGKGQGKLDVHIHTTLRRGARTVPGGWRSTDQGTILRRPELLVPSGRVFGARTSAGAILIDYSGSMQWQPAVIKQAVRTMPRLWAALYSAALRTAGRLCIVAQGARIGAWDGAAEDKAHGRYNGCDWLALAYMAKASQGPYVWVSDGAVLGDASHYQRCSALQQRHRIARVLTIEDAIAYLQGKRVQGAWTLASNLGSTRELEWIHK